MNSSLISFFVNFHYTVWEQDISTLWLFHLECND